MIAYFFSVHKPQKQKIRRKRTGGGKSAYLAIPYAI